MKLFQIILLLTTILMAGCGGGESTPPKKTSDYDHIKTTYENYKTALLAEDGRKLMLLIDAASKDYYKKLLTYAQKADSTGIADSGLAEKMTILMARQLMPRDELSQMDLARIFRCYRKKWYDW